MLGVVSTLTGSPGVSGLVDGAGTSAKLFAPYFLTVGASGVVYFADQGNNMIRMISPSGITNSVASSFFCCQSNCHMVLLMIVL